MQMQFVLSSRKWSILVLSPASGTAKVFNAAAIVCYRLGKNCIFKHLEKLGLKSFFVERNLF